MISNIIERRLSPLSQKMQSKKLLMLSLQQMLKLTVFPMVLGLSNFSGDLVDSFHWGFSERDYLRKDEARERETQNKKDEKDKK